MVKEMTLFAVLMLSGCAQWQPVTTAATAPQSKAEFCREAFPIIVSPLDKLTTDTAHEIATHDNNGARLCGWKKVR